MSSGWAPIASTRAGDASGPAEQQRQHHPEAAEAELAAGDRGRGPTPATGRVPLSCRLSSHCWSLSVSIGAQNPSCRCASTLPAASSLLERLLDEVLAGAELVEELPAQDEVAAVDPDVGARHVAHRRDAAVVVHRDHVEAVVRADREEARRHVARPLARPIIAGRSASVSVSP